MPLSLLAVGVAVLVFFRMNAGGQFDDAEGPAWSVLMDNDRAPADLPLMQIKKLTADPADPCHGPDDEPTESDQHR